jgi:hypothetical protein
VAKRKLSEDVAGVDGRAGADKLARRVQAAGHDVTESRTRQTYYVPEDLHRELKVAAITRGMKVSDLVCEGIREVLKRHKA